MSELSDLENVFRQFCQDQGLDYEEFEAEEWDGIVNFSNGSEEYSVMDESQAETAFDERMDDYIDEYIDECILSKIPDNLRFYFDFDSEAFKRDVELSDGRGPTMATYDGHEHEYFPPNSNTAYYIYRTN